MKPVWTVAFAMFSLLTTPFGAGQAGEDGPENPAGYQIKFTEALTLLESDRIEDIDRALGLLERAAREGAPIHVILGDLYSRGTRAPRDFQKAARWYLIAAESGDGIGQLEMGKLYLDGRGVAINLVMSILYLELARGRIRDAGLKREAEKHLARAKRHASLEDWREVKKRLDTWRPKPLSELLN